MGQRERDRVVIVGHVQLIFELIAGLRIDGMNRKGIEDNGGGV